MRLEYHTVGDMANVNHESMEIYLYVSDHHYKGLVNIRNIILCNYLYL